MHTKEDFVKAILDQPLDNALRLVYADFLQENGDEEYVRFIRVQMKLHELLQGGSPAPSAERTLLCEDLWQQEKKLKTVYWNRIRSKMLSLFPRRSIGIIGSSEIDTTDANNPSPVLRCRRGFVDHLSCDANGFYKVSAGLFMCQPVTSVRLSDLSPRIRRNGKNMYGWYGAMNSDPHQPNYLLSPVFNRLSFQFEHRLYDDRYTSPPFCLYPSELHAWVDLSRAAVNYGRWRAGLEEIEWEPLPTPAA